MIPTDVQCLFSHKCSLEQHDFARHIRPIFRSESVILQVDPFGPGVDVRARIQTVEFQALTFVFSSESWASEYCRAELAAAQAAYLPVFSIRWSGELPGFFRRRIFLDLADREYSDLADELRGLAQAVRTRGVIRSLVEKLRFPNRPEVVRAAAEGLADETDGTALAEFLDCLELAYKYDMDPIARGSLAFAVGKTATLKAKQMLSAWKCSSDHPYPQQCISQALECIANTETSKKGEEV